MSEIRVNRVVSADGSSAPQFPSGLSLATGMGITNSPNITGSAVTFSGISKVTNATDSTSSTTGSLIVTGGVGIAKNVYIGAGLSVAGTLTYEDVTNVDSVGVVTAKSGVNISGGELLVGTAVTVGSAGVSTFNADVVFDGATADRDITFDKSRDALAFKDNAYAEFGNSQDLQIYHDGSHSYIKDGGTGELRLATSQFTVQNAAANETLLYATSSGVGLKYNDSLKLLTNNDGVSITGIATATGGLAINADSKNLTIGAGDDLKLYADGSNSVILHNGDGDLLILSEGSSEDIKLKASENVDLMVSSSETAIHCDKDGSVTLYWDNSERFSTTGAGTSSVGISTVNDFSSTGMLKEKVKVVGNKLSAASNIDLKDGNIYYFTTNETTTGTPNLRYDGSNSLNNKMLIADTVSVTIIFKPNGAGYYAQLTIDSSAVTEEWNGGSAPGSASAGGYDVYTYSITKTADASFLVLANFSNFA